MTLPPGSERAKVLVHDHQFPAPERVMLRVWDEKPPAHEAFHEYVPAVRLEVLRAEADSHLAAYRKLQNVIRHAAPQMSTTPQAIKCVKAMGEHYPGLLRDLDALRARLADAEATLRDIAGHVATCIEADDCQLYMESAAHQYFHRHDTAGSPKETHDGP